MKVLCHCLTQLMGRTIQVELTNPPRLVYRNWTGRTPTMSHRDRDLIRYAGLSVEAVASLLGRTRQAIYQGMSSTTRHYFGTSEVLLMFQDAKRRKLKYLDTLRSFIETEYDPNLAELIAPDRINDSRAVRLIEESQEII